MILFDGQLVEAACKGDASAIEKLLALSQPDLRRFARRSCATSEDADDAVQVALWNLQRNIGSLRVVAALASWMFKVVERECFRLLRIQRKTEELTDDMPGPCSSRPTRWPCGATWPAPWRSCRPTTAKC